jgi:hypothetical protein
MATITRRPHGTRAVNFCLDVDALELLYAMVPGHVGIGRLMSELVRKEARERAARPYWVATLRQQAEAAIVQEAERAVG